MLIGALAFLYGTLDFLYSGLDTEVLTLVTVVTLDCEVCFFLAKSSLRRSRFRFSTTE